MDLSVSSSSWYLGRAAVCDCDNNWTFLLPFFSYFVFVSHLSFFWCLRRAEVRDCGIPWYLHLHFCSHAYKKKQHQIINCTLYLPAVSALLFTFMTPTTGSALSKLDRTLCIIKIIRLFINLSNTPRELLQSMFYNIVYQKGRQILKKKKKNMALPRKRHNLKKEP